MVVLWAAFVAACSHPIEIVGEGDVISESGDRDCTFAAHAAGAEDCTENLVIGEYDETYEAVPADGWHFHRWANYCTESADGTCTFDVPADVVEDAYGKTVPPLIAIFRPDVVTGFDSLFIGHSFFIPIARGVGAHAIDAGFVDHTQQTVFSGGSSGAPEALWNDEAKRGVIQAALDTGDIDLFGMTYHPTYPTLAGYRLWLDYALEQNPDTRVFVGLPWLTDPGQLGAAAYSSQWHAAHETAFHGLIDSLRDEYPGVDIYGLPYGQAAVELFELFDAGQLPDVDSLVSGTGDAIYSDAFGHADDILVDLAELVWLRAIYGIELSSYDHDPGYVTDLKALADEIMEEHDPLYDAP